MAVPIFTAPLQCAESLHLGTLVSLLHTDVIHRLRTSCGTQSEHLLFWNVTGRHAEKAAVSLGLEVSESGCEKAVSRFVEKNLEEIASWDIGITATYRDDQSDVTAVEQILNSLRGQERLVQKIDGWNLAVNVQRVREKLKELPVESSVRNKLRQCMESFPALCRLHKERIYATRVAGYDNLSLDPKLCVALMPILYGSGGTLVLGEDVIERILLHHLIIAPLGCTLGRAAVHGMLWGEDGKKMSRYASNAIKAGESVLNSDIVRASILARPMMSGMKIESLQIAQAVQLRSQFERILNGIGVHTVRWREPDPTYLEAVHGLNFQTLFQWFRLAINKELRDLVIKITEGSATETETLRAHSLCTIIGETIFPRTYIRKRGH